MTKRRERRRAAHLAATVLLPLASVFVTLAAIELGLALFHPIPYSIERNMYFAPDPFTGYRLQPNSLGYYQDGIPARANSNGHRDDETTVDKPEGVFRIMVLGDSFSVGANVRQDEAYPQVLERLLQRDCGPHIEVVNTAVGGWGPFQYAQYFEHYGVRFDPDLVLVGFFVGNDTTDAVSHPVQLKTAVRGRRVSRHEAQSKTVSAKVWLSEYFHLARLAFVASPGQFAVRRKNCHSFPKQFLDIQRQRLVIHNKVGPPLSRRSWTSVEQLTRLRAAADIPDVVVLLPDENQINPALQQRLIPPGRRKNFDFDMPQRHLVRALHGAGIATIDLLETFRNDERCLYMNDTHWTAEGHELAATEIARQLMPALPCK